MLFYAGVIGLTPKLILQHLLGFSSSIGWLVFFSIAVSFYGVLLWLNPKKYELTPEELSIHFRDGTIKRVPKSSIVTAQFEAFTDGPFFTSWMS